MVNTFIKCYTHDTYRNSFMFYYSYIRLNIVLPTGYFIHNASHVTTPFCASIITTIQRFLNLPGFPNIHKDKIYESMFIEEKSLVELQYPTMNWQKVWSNYRSIFIYSYDKEIVYKHLHMVLATHNRLFRMNIIESSKCYKYTANREDTHCIWCMNVTMWNHYFFGSLDVYQMSVILDHHQTLGFYTLITLT